MAGLEQKNPFVQTMNRFAENKIEAAQELIGKKLPASVVSVSENGTIVTVNFEVQSDLFTLPQITCSLATTRYIRAPIQVGDKGYVVPADIYMGGMTGLGGGVASVEQQSNLANQVFVPVGNSSFKALVDAMLVNINGPEGGIIYDDEETVFLIVKKGRGIEIVAELGGNALKGNWTEASSDAEAKGKGIPYLGLYANPDGSIKWQRIPD